MHLSLHHLSFTQPDPLGDGLREEIEAEKLESEAIDLNEQPTGEQLQDYLQNIIIQSEQDFGSNTYSEER